MAAVNLRPERAHLNSITSRQREISNVFNQLLACRSGGAQKTSQRTQRQYSPQKTETHTPPKQRNTLDFLSTPVSVLAPTPLSVETQKLIDAQQEELEGLKKMFIQLQDQLRTEREEREELARQLTASNIERDVMMQSLQHGNQNERETFFDSPSAQTLGFGKASASPLRQMSKSQPPASFKELDDFVEQLEGVAPDSTDRDLYGSPPNLVFDAEDEPGFM